MWDWNPGPLLFGNSGLLLDSSQRRVGDRTLTCLDFTSIEGIIVGWTREQ